MVRGNDSGEGMGGNAGKGDAGNGHAKGARRDWTLTVCTAVGLTFLSVWSDLVGHGLGISPVPTPLRKSRTRACCS